MARKSRLSKNFQKKSRNTLFLSVLGIILILFLLFKFGLPLISDASFLFGRVTSTPESNEENSEKEVFVPIPRIYSIPNDTNEQNLTVNGSSLSGLTIEIYLNGEKVGEVKADKSGEFKLDITLTEGANILKARAIKNEIKSEFSNSININFTNSGPELKIESPLHNSDIKGGNPIEIKGNSDKDSTVTVNGFQAIINAEGNWSYFLTLVDGGNDIAIVSIDAAGNKTEETIHVNYSQ